MYATPSGKNLPRPASLIYDVDYKLKSLLLLRYNFYDLFVHNHKCYFCRKEIDSSKMFGHIQLEHTKERSSLKAGKCADSKRGTKKAEKFKSSSKKSNSQRFLVNASVLKRSNRLSKCTKLNGVSQNEQNLKQKAAEYQSIVQRFPVLKLHRLEESEIKTKTTRSSTSTTVLSEASKKSDNVSKQPLISNGRKLRSSLSHLNSPQNQTTTEIQQRKSANSDKKFRFCRKQFLNPQSLKNHLLKMHEPSQLRSKFHCRRCTKSFVIKENLIRHTRKSHSTSKVVKQYHCEHCKEQFTFKKNLIQHNKSHHSKLKQTMIKCYLRKIKQVHQLKSDLNARKTNNQHKKFHCQPCKKSFFLKSNLMQHIRLRHVPSKTQNMTQSEQLETQSQQPKSYQCDVCKKTFLYAKVLSKHLETHKAPEERIKIQCHICTLSFFWNKDLKRHIRKKHSTIKIKSNKSERPKTYECDLCTNTYTLRQSFVNHKRFKHSTIDSNQLQSCQFCEKTFLYPESLKKHLETHMAPEKRTKFQCPHCTVSFFWKKNLESHIRTQHSTSNIISKKSKEKRQHSKTSLVSSNKQTVTESEHFEIPKPCKTYQCDICTKTSTLRTSLNNHKWIKHSTSHLLKSCKVCGKTFKNSKNFKRHLETHKPSKKRTKFQCHVCEKSYTFNQNLQRHINTTHSTTNSNLLQTCKFCGESFFEAQTLKRHLETHKAPEDRVKFQCQHCTSSFSWKGGLQSHMRKKHATANIKSNKSTEKLQNSTMKKTRNDQNTTYNKTKPKHRKTLEAIFGVPRV